MSRSYRKPYSSITGVPRSHNDKKLAARGLRRKRNQWLNCVADFDETLLPHRLECFGNNPYNWLRDGHQRFVKSHGWLPEQDAYMRSYWIKLQRT